MRVAFCSSEVFPFAKTGGLGDVCGALPLALEKLGVDVDIFLPKYGWIAKKFKIKKVSENCFTTIIGKKTRVFFVSNDRLFDRHSLYGYNDEDYPDNLERFQFFAEGVFNICTEQKLTVDILHCHDWQTGLLPVYLREKYRDNPFFKKTKSLMTLHNLAYQGLFPKELFPTLKFDKALFTDKALKFYDKISLLKGGIIFSDAVNTVSPQYAKEIQGKELGYGLDGFLKNHPNPVKGIVNGIDQDVWNPETDKQIHENYSVKDAKELKGQNKSFLQKKVGLPVRKAPLFGMVARLTHQKGVEILLDVLGRLSTYDIQIVIQGIGEEKYASVLRWFCSKNPKKFVLLESFDEELAHQIYAASDFFLMPSLFEPCGLSQMISMKYGALPIVHATGGLADTVKSFNEFKLDATGFAFKPYDKDKLFAAIEEAMKVFGNQKTFSALQSNAMKADFSWEKSAQQYKDFYQWLLSA